LSARLPDKISSPMMMMPMAGAASEAEGLAGVMVMF
jgi:hypothetical protein